MIIRRRINHRVTLPGTSQDTVRLFRFANDGHPYRTTRVPVLSGAVPEGRHAPLASADQHAASGEGVRHR